MITARQGLLGIATFAALLVGATACGSSGPYVWVNELSNQEAPEEPVIQPRDTILVEVRNQPTMTGEFFVREDGHYTQPLLGSVRVGGSTPSAAAAMIAGLLKGVVVDPRVMVWLSKPAPIKVNVVGEVKTPGIFELTRDRTVLGALSAAGCINEFAKRDGIYVVRMRDRQRIRFRVTDITSPEGLSSRFRLRDGDAVVVE